MLMEKLADATLCCMATRSRQGEHHPPAEGIHSPSQFGYFASGRIHCRAGLTILNVAPHDTDPQLARMDGADALPQRIPGGRHHRPAEVEADHPSVILGIGGLVLVEQGGGQQYGALTAKTRTSLAAHPGVGVRLAGGLRYSRGRSAWAAYEAARPGLARLCPPWCVTDGSQDEYPAIIGADGPAQALAVRRERLTAQ